MRGSEVALVPTFRVAIVLLAHDILSLRHRTLAAKPTRLIDELVSLVVELSSCPRMKHQLLMIVQVQSRNLRLRTCNHLLMTSAAISFFSKISYIRLEMLNLDYLTAACRLFALFKRYAQSSGGCWSRRLPFEQGHNNDLCIADLPD
jgi:hypothetical protein